MNHRDIPPPRFSLPDGEPSNRVAQAARRLYFRLVVVDLIRHLPGAFDHEHACPYCLAHADDPREARLRRLDLGRLGFGRGVVLMCPGCGFEEEA